jgi:hypothetical protein
MAMNTGVFTLEIFELLQRFSILVLLFLSAIICADFRPGEACGKGKSRFPESTYIAVIGASSLA